MQSMRVCVHSLMLACVLLLQQTVSAFAVEQPAKAAPTAKLRPKPKWYLKTPIEDVYLKFGSPNSPRIMGLRIEKVRLKSAGSDDGSAPPIVRVSGVYTDFDASLVYGQETVKVDPDSGDFVIDVPLDGPVTSVILTAVDGVGGVAKQKFFLDCTPGARFRDPASVPMGAESHLSAAFPRSPIFSRPALGIVLRPSYLILSQVLQSTLDKVERMAPQLLSAELKYRQSVGESFQAELGLGFQTFSQPATDLGTYLLVNSEASLVSAELQMSYVHTLRGGAEFRPFVALGFVPSYLYEFSSNTELTLNSISDLRFSFGASAVMALPGRRNDWMIFSFAMGQGLGKFSTEVSTWSGSDQYLGRVTYLRPLTPRTRLLLGVDASVRKNSYLIERDTWIQDSTDLGATLGVEVGF